MTKTEELLKLAEAVYSPFKDDWERSQAEKLLCVSASPQTIKQLVELVRLQHETLRLYKHISADHGRMVAAEAIEAFEKFERGE